MELSAEQRQTNLQTMSQEQFDLAIIGGGITGAGVARDAASRGLKVALIEAGDFAIGTSSRSSKLIHGGIRYLEQKEFSLVFEALSERQHLFDIAPHLVHPLRFMIPLYQGGRVGMRLMGLGMWLYDILSLWEAPELHAKLDVQEVSGSFPYLSNDGLMGAYAYSDAYMDDDRLVFETMRSAANFGACVTNYVKAVGVEWAGGEVSAVVAEDILGKKKFSVRAKHVMSTVGPWTDEVAVDLLKSWKKILRPSKGVHLTFHRERLPLKDAIVMAAEERIVFGIPRHDMVIVGTTDTDFGKDPSQVRPEKEDVEYLLKVTNRYFPGARITEKDIVSAYAGVRPLVDDQSQTESKTSREHLIYVDPRNVTFVAGGKYTTYRLMAQQAVDVVLKKWDLSERARLSKNQTLQPLNPRVTVGLLEAAKNASDRWSDEVGVSQFVTSQLAERHGLEAREILRRYLPRLRAMTDSQDEIFYGLEALHAIDQTMCLSLRDFVFRRTHLFLAESDHGESVWHFISKVMATRLGWSEQERLDQINALQKQIAFELEWRIDSQRTDL
jgi:glycerol-3-phosphate dehydrogenase